MIGIGLLSAYDCRSIGRYKLFDSASLTVPRVGMFNWICTKRDFYM